MLLFSIKEVYEVLCYGGKDDIAMPEHERILLKQLLNDNDCIEASTGKIVDGKAHISSGALDGIRHQKN